MGRLSLRYDLLDEVVISSRTGSVGGQPGLDYLPGSNLLGAAAAMLYPTLSREDAWLLFHSGKVRFGNALPLAGEESAWPIPLSWRLSATASSFCKQGRLRAGKVYNLTRCRLNDSPLDPASTATPLPAGYVTLSGRYHRPKTIFRMKNVVSPETNHPDKERTFGYESLAEGQSFIADLAYDEDVPERLVEKLLGFFASAPTMTFGRSRSAQYGRVNCRFVSAPLIVPASLPQAGQELSLWLLSDLAACDRHGFPTLAPEAEALGLPPADPVPAKTFLRCRTYSPYNGFHQLHSSERQVICQGSVLTFRPHHPLSPAELNEIAGRIARGLGLYREAGLGRCVLEPALLATWHPEFTATAQPSPIPPAPPAPDHPLARWLVETTENRSLQGGTQHWAKQALTELDQLERNARRLSGLREDQSASPGRSLWGRVAEAARRATGSNHEYKSLHNELFGEANSVCTSHQADWYQLTADVNGQPLTYRDWLEHKMAERPNDAASAICLLAELAQRRPAGES